MPLFRTKNTDTDLFYNKDSEEWNKILQNENLYTFDEKRLEFLACVNTKC